MSKIAMMVIWCTMKTICYDDLILAACVMCDVPPVCEAGCQARAGTCGLATSPAWPALSWCLGKYKDAASIASQLGAHQCRQQAGTEKERGEREEHRDCEWQEIIITTQSQQSEQWSVIRGEDGHSHHGRTVWPGLGLRDIRYLYIDLWKFWAVATILVLFSQVMGMDFIV